MQTRTTFGLATATAAVVLLGPATLAAQQGADFRWTGRLAAGKTLEVKGINGDITAQPASGDQIEVTAAKHARRSDPESVEIRVVEHEDGVTICAVYPTPRGKPANECAPGSGGHSSNENNDVEVDFTVRVPQNVRLAIATVNGGVEAEGLGSDVDASTVNGGVTVSTRGIAEATTVNGSVRVSMGRADWRGPVRISTVNGGVDVVLPGSPDVDVRASTVNGDLESDFPMTVKGKWGPRRMTGTIGRGGRSLELETVNGAIRLRKAS